MALLLAYAAPAEGKAVAERHPGHVLETGVGKTAAAASLTAAILERAPDAVLMFGVCGAYPSRHLPADTRAARIGELCVVGGDRFGDEGVQTEGEFLDLAALGLGSSDAVRADEFLVASLVRSTGARVVQGSTVSTCSGNEALSQARAAVASVQIETMEGAAAAFVCQCHGVPFAQLRCVSNYTGDRSRSNWQLELAVAHLTKALLEHLEIAGTNDRP